MEIENYNGKIEAKLYDFTGKHLLTTNNTKISLADCPSGVYLLKICHGNMVDQLKVIKE